MQNKNHEKSSQFMDDVLTTAPDYDKTLVGQTSHDEE